VKTRTTSFLLLACIGCASKPAPPAPPAQTFASCVLLIQVNDYKGFIYMTPSGEKAGQNEHIAAS
jgi:hypothetical protein